MSSEHERRGALEAVDRIVNRGGDADDVLRAVLHVLSQLYPYVGLAFVEGGDLVLGPTVGARVAGASFPVQFHSRKVAELEIAEATDEDAPFVERVAVLISPYCLVGWDTRGQQWTP